MMRSRSTRFHLKDLFEERYGLEKTSSQQLSIHCKSNVLAIINATSSQIINTFGVCCSPATIAYNSNNKDLCVAQSGSNNVSAIDPHTNAVIATIGVGSSLDAIAHPEQHMQQCSLETTRVRCASSSPSTSQTRS